MERNVLIPQIQFRPSEGMAEVLTALADGISLSLAAKEQLEFHLCAIERDLESTKLNRNEMEVVFAALANTIIMPDTVTLLWAIVDESLRKTSTIPNPVDRNALINKLRSLTYGQLVALAMAARRYLHNLREAEKCEERE